MALISWMALIATLQAAHWPAASKAENTGAADTFKGRSMWATGRAPELVLEHHDLSVRWPGRHVHSDEGCAKIYRRYPAAGCGVCGVTGGP